VFAKLQKANISFIMTVCMEQLGSCCADFYEILYFPKSGEKIQYSLISDKNKKYFT
jgi:hypothetical protein